MCSVVDVSLLEFTPSIPSVDLQCKCATSPQGRIVQGLHNPGRGTDLLLSVLVWCTVDSEESDSMMAKEASSEGVWTKRLALGTGSNLC